MRSSRLNSEGLVITRPAEQRAPELERKARRERRSQGSWLLPGKSSSRLPANAKRDTRWLFPHGVLLPQSYYLTGGKKTGKSVEAREMVPRPEQAVIPSVLEGALSCLSLKPKRIRCSQGTTNLVPMASPSRRPSSRPGRQPIPSDVSDYALTARQSKSPEPAAKAPATATGERDAGVHTPPAVRAMIPSRRGTGP